MIDVAEPTGHLPPAEGLAAAEPSAHAIIDLTPTGIVSSWNPGAALLFGYPEVEMVGRAADLLCPPGGRSADAEVVRRVMTEGGTERYEADRICKNGTVVTVSLTVAPIVNLAGAVVGVTTDSWKPSTLRRGVKKIEAQIDGEQGRARAVRGEGRHRAPRRAGPVRGEGRRGAPRRARRAGAVRGEGRRRAPECAGGVRGEGRRGAPRRARRAGAVRGEGRHRAPGCARRAGAVRSAARRRAPRRS